MVDNTALLTFSLFSMSFVVVVVVIVVVVVLLVFDASAAVSVFFSRLLSEDDNVSWL